MVLANGNARRVVRLTFGGTTASLEQCCVRYVDNFSSSHRGATSTECVLGIPKSWICCYISAPKVNSYFLVMPYNILLWYMTYKIILCLVWLLAKFPAILMIPYLNASSLVMSQLIKIFSFCWMLWFIQVHMTDRNWMLPPTPPPSCMIKDNPLTFRSTLQRIQSHDITEVPDMAWSDCLKWWCQVSHEPTLFAWFLIWFITALCL